MAHNDIEKLISQLGRDDDAGRRSAITQLEAKIPYSEKQVATALVDHLDDDDHFVRQSALALFSKMSEQALEPIINGGLNSDDFFVQRAAMDAIGRIGSDAGVPYLVKGLTSSDHYVRWQAAKGLAQFPGGDATAALIKALRDRHPLVRDRVAASLIRHGADGKAAVEGWKPGRSRKLRRKFKPPAPKPEGDGGVVAETDLEKESGYLYYLGKDGDIWRTRMARGTVPGGGAEKVADAGVTRERGWLYYIDKQGNVSRTLLKRGG